MHVRSLLKLGMFDIEIDGQAATREDVFPDWCDSDRMGVVIDAPLGGIGATHLMQLAMTAFYDIKPSRRDELAVYPEIYAFHVGKGFGSHAPYDIWPARREVILEGADHRDLLDAINDRGITRLVIPERQESLAAFRPKEEEAALDRLVSCFIYSPETRVDNADLLIRGTDARTEYNVNQTLKSVADRGYVPNVLPAGSALKEADTAYMDWLVERDADVSPDMRAHAKAVRQSLRENGLVAETYRRISAQEALRRLASFG